MNRVLFISNGHGEEAIAGCIAEVLRVRAGLESDHLALVGDSEGGTAMRPVGPRRAMPSGGLVAMGNVRNILRDTGAGLLRHTFAQLQFLRSIRRQYVVAAAIGDAFALFMTLQARAVSTVFAGTAKSVRVARYGPFEERLLRNADAVFVRDSATADLLQAHGIDAHAANAIVDLYAKAGVLPVTGFDPLIALFPGSRERAYEDAVFLAGVVRAVRRTLPRAGALLSVAPRLDLARFVEALDGDGWEVQQGSDPERPFTLASSSTTLVHAWRGSIGAMLDASAVVLGQAGTANEAAAARGIPVVAFDAQRGRDWYRRRQAGLLGEALAMGPRDVEAAARYVVELLADAPRCGRMAEAGRRNMGDPGGATRIADAIAQLAESAEGR